MTTYAIRHDLIERFGALQSCIRLSGDRGVERARNMIEVKVLALLLNFFGAFIAMLASSLCFSFNSCIPFRNLKL